MVGTVTVMSSAKRRYVSITHTASRAADSATMAIGPREPFPRDGKGVKKSADSCVCSTVDV